MRVVGTLLLTGFVMLPGIASAQTPLPGGVPSDEALRKLAAQLGVPPNGLPKLSPEQLEQLKQMANNPEFRKLIEQQIQENPKLIEQLKQSDPNLARKIQSELPNLTKPTTTPGETPKMPNIPNQPFQPNGQPQANPNFPKKTNPAEDSKEFQEMAKLWEQNFGSLDNTPAVKQALIDMLSGSPGSKPGGKPFWADWDPKATGGSSNSGFMKWLQGLNGGGNAGGNSKLKLPKWFGNQAKSLSAPSVKMPTAPKMPSMGFSGFDIGIDGLKGMGTAGMVGMIAVLAALVAFLVWKFAPQLGLARNRKPRPLPGLGPWPIDPRTIADRAGLILAFEYISVLLCGDGARVWNHATIAEALRDSVPAAAPFADPLAKLYALARYTPQSEELSAEAVAEARRHLCQLAGVPTP